jgi:hypothetical protein
METKTDSWHFLRFIRSCAESSPSLNVAALAMTPEQITPDGDEEILQESETSEPDDVEEMAEQDDD